MNSEEYCKLSAGQNILGAGIIATLWVAFILFLMLQFGLDLFKVHLLGRILLASPLFAVLFIILKVLLTNCKRS